MTEHSPGCVDTSAGSLEEPDTADAAWDTLTASLLAFTPPCDGQALFTADGLSDEQSELCIHLRYLSDRGSLRCIRDRSQRRAEVGRAASITAHVVKLGRGLVPIDAMPVRLAL